MTDATRFPLSWPFGWKRTAASQRKRAKFGKSYQRYGDGGSNWRDRQGLTVRQGLDRLYGEMGRMGGVSHTLVSSNITVTLNGDPRSGQREPDDPGVAVYFKLKGKDRVLACDRWDRVADNLAAIAAHIECIRGIDRYGVGTLDQAFAGYDALPPPGANNRPPWRKVFGIPDDMPATPSAVQGFYRDLARKLHPDVPGGSHEAMAMLNEARDAALRELA